MIGTTQNSDSFIPISDTNTTRNSSFYIRNYLFNGSGSFSGTNKSTDDPSKYVHQTGANGHFTFTISNNYSVNTGQIIYSGYKTGAMFMKVVNNMSEIIQI